MQRCDIISTRNNQLDSSVSVHLLRNQTCDSTITLKFFYKVYTLPPSTAVVLELREQEEKPQQQITKCNIFVASGFLTFSFNIIR